MHKTYIKHHRKKLIFRGGGYTPLAITREPEVTGVWNFPYKSFKPTFNKFYDIDFYRVSCQINSDSVYPILYKILLFRFNLKKKREMEAKENSENKPIN